MARFLPAPAALTALALFVASGVWFTRDHDFPFFYHPDETGKVEQVLDGKLNFHHPPLLLETTRLAVQLGRVPRNPQAVVTAGRTVSALFCAGAVAVLALLAWQMRGPFAGLLTGALLLTHHQLFELAHYLKEDTSLLFGLTVALWGAWRVCQKRSAAHVLLLALGCALAISGKYLGALTLIPAAIAFTSPGPRAKPIALFLICLVIALVALNFPMLQNLVTARASFTREVTLVAGGQGGMTAAGPNFAYLHAFRDNTTAALTPLLALALFGAWRQRHILSRGDWLILAFPFAFALALSLSPKTNDRYFLPATAFFVLLAALAAAALRPLLTRRLPGWLACAICFALPLGLQIPDLLEYARAFRIDDRVALTKWLQTDLPASAILVQDRRVLLPTPQRPDLLPFQTPIPQSILGKNLQSDFTSLAQLKAAGVTHVVISETDYGRYFVKSLRPQESYAQEFAVKRQLYDDLFHQGQLLWKRPRGTVIYLHPGLEIYALPP